MSRLIFGVISDNSKQLNRLISSLKVSIRESGYLFDEYKLIVLQNGKNIKLENSVGSLNIEFLKNKYRESISKNRTYIQKYIFNNSQNGDTIWIVDDDLTFNRDIDYFKFIDKIKRSSRTDAIFGFVTGTPPLPFLSTLNSELIDLLFNLQHKKVGKEHRLKHNRRVKTKSVDYYYDNSLINQQIKEPLYYLDGDFSRKIETLSKGLNVSRTVEFKKKDIGRLGKTSIFRGGNTIIFNRELLKIPNYYFSEISYNRRSDFNWAVINRDICGRELREVILPLQHNREDGNISVEQNIQKIKADIEGRIFYRVLEEILHNSSNKDIMRKFYVISKNIFKKVKNSHKESLKLLYKIEKLSSRDSFIHLRQLRVIVKKEIKLLKRVELEIELKELDISSIRKDIKELFC